MAGVNKVILLGNLGADPEVKVISTGAKTARLRIATSETYTNKSGEKITNVEWHTVNVWRGQADVAEKYLSKGKPVYIEGRLRTRSYDDKDGNTKYITEIEADVLTLIGGKGGNDGDSNSDSSSNASSGSSNTSGSSNSSSSSKSPKSKDLKPESDEDSLDDLPF